MSRRKTLYRVKFQEKREPSAKPDQGPTTVVVESFKPSEHFGLVCLEKFVFPEQTKLVLLPDEDENRKRFGKTDRLHLPYHVLLSVEEFHEDEPELKSVPSLTMLHET